MPSFHLVSPRNFNEPFPADLTDLEISSLDWADVVDILPRIPVSLKTLTFIETGLDVDVSIAVSSRLASLPNLTTLEIFNPNLKTSENFRSFIVEKIKHGEDGEYREGLEKASAMILKPRLSANFRAQGGSHYLACRSLLLAGMQTRRLSLSGISLGSALKPEVVKNFDNRATLAEFYQKNSEGEISPRNADQIAPVFHALDCLAVSLKFANVELLDLSRNGLYDACITRLAECLPSAPCLAEINFAGNFLSNFGFIDILIHSSFSQKIARLDFSGNQITLDGGLQGLARRAVINWGAKEWLKLAGNPIKPAGVRAWSEIFAGVCDDLGTGVVVPTIVSPARTLIEDETASEPTSRSVSDSVSDSASASSTESETRELMQAIADGESLPSSDSEDSNFSTSS